MGKLLTANDIIGAKDLVDERVEVPEWGGDVILRSLSALDREEVEAETTEIETKFDEKGAIRFVPHLNPVRARAKFLARAIVDEDGNRIFDEKQLEGLAKKAEGPLDRLYRRARELSAVALPDAEAAEKNFAAVPSGASSSV